MTLRDAVPEDATAVATLHVRAYRAAYRGTFPDEILDALQPQDRVERYQFGALGSSRSTIVACLGGLVRGFVTVGPSRDADLSGHGEIYALYVDPAEWDAALEHA